MAIFNDIHDFLINRCGLSLKYFFRKEEGILVAQHMMTTLHGYCKKLQVAVMSTDPFP